MKEMRPEKSPDLQETHENEERFGFSRPTTNNYFHFIEDPATGKRRPDDSMSSSQKAQEIAEFEAQRQAHRTEMLAALEHNEAGIDTTRVHGFLDSLDLPITPYVIANEPIAEFNDDPTLEGSEWKNDATAGHNSLWQFSMLYRDRLKSDGEAEKALVHELFHGTGINTLNFVTRPGQRGQLRVGRAGLVTDKKGNFLEEGFAELVAVTYGEIFGLSHDQPITVFDHDWPGKYVDKAHPEDQSHYILAGMSMELLIAKDNDLLDAIIRSRTNPDALREVARRIDALSPGLYNKLRNIERTNKGFLHGIQTVFVGLYDGDWSAIAEAPRRAQTKEYFEAKMRG